MRSPEKPRLLFLRPAQQNLPDFIGRHLQEQVRCLAHAFDVTEVPACGDYRALCERHRPDLSLFESGVYTDEPRLLTNTDAFPGIPKIGFLHCDAYCPTRSVFFSDMARWGVRTFFSLSVSMGEYTPEIAGDLYVWPNGFDPDLYRDYGERKSIPVLFTGSQASHYPWRNRVRARLAARYPMMTVPHFGWFDRESGSGTVHGEPYARLLNAAVLAPTCGTIAKDVVRKHFEVPACRTCLITEYTPALAAAGFVDMENCVFTDEAGCLEKVDLLFRDPGLARRIADNGHELVHGRHTFRHRDQIRQWFDLQATLRPGQKVVQPDPFSPLVVIEAAPAAMNGQRHAGARDRALLAQGEAALSAGKIAEAETLFRRCLNYHASTPEPRLGLARCALRRGDPQEARRLAAELIDIAMKRHGALDPDPVEWSLFILAELCRGDVEAAAARLGEFPSLRHPELDRLRTLLTGATPGTGGVRRESVHVLPPRSDREWREDIAALLHACGQSGLAARLRSGGPLRSASAAPRPSGSPGGGLGDPARPAVLRKLLAHGRRVLRDPAHARRLLGRFRAPDEFASVIGRVAAEAEIRSALLVSDRRWSPRADALSAGVGRNPCLPGIARMSGRDLAGSAQRPAAKGPPAFDLVLVEAAMPAGIDLTGCLGAARVVMIGHLTRAGNHEAFQALLRMAGTFRLLAHDPMQAEGYAVVVSDAAGL